MSVGYCMGQRKNGLEVGRVCESCKAFAPPFALRLSRDLEAEGTLDEAEEFRRLAETLLKETGPDQSGHWETTPDRFICGRLLRLRSVWPGEPAMYATLVALQHQGDAASGTPRQAASSASGMCAFVSSPCQ